MGIEVYANIINCLFDLLKTFGSSHQFMIRIGFLQVTGYCIYGNTFVHSEQFKIIIRFCTLSLNDGYIGFYQYGWSVRVDFQIGGSYARKFLGKIDIGFYFGHYVG